MANQKTKQQTVADFIAAPPPRNSRCATCGDRASFRDAIAEFAAAVDAGKTIVTWSQFHRDYLVAQLGYPHSYSALLNHLRGCLKKEKGGR